MRTQANDRCEDSKDDRIDSRPEGLPDQRRPAPFLVQAPGGMMRYGCLIMMYGR